MNLTDKQLEQIILEESFVKKEDLEALRGEHDIAEGELIDYLLQDKLLTKDLLGQAIAESLELDYLDLNTNPPTKEEALRIPSEIAKNHRVVLYNIDEDKKVITLATDTPEVYSQVESQIREIFPNYELKLGFSVKEDIDNVLLYYQEDLTDRLTEIIKSQEKFAPALVSEVFNEALARKASDIHMEPFDENVVLRFRIDGVLTKVGELPADVYKNIINRIKVMASLRVDDHFSAQDGAIRFRADSDIDVDMRVSVAPVIEGEKITIRVLSSYVKGFALEELGLSSADQKIIEENSEKPFGMILTVGPTGSGKTTTLYSVLKMINRIGVNITTIEDPVEYRIRGINQIQVNKETNLTFSKGLRSIVRQDPDIILVGEIRDKETAEIGVNAAMTGHLLLSTFHANDAATAIPRLIDMGTEPFLLSSGLELIIAQRLVRRICEKCRISYDFDEKEFKDHPKYKSVIKQLGSKKKMRLYKGKGCNVCQGTGYKGRIGIFELLEVTDKIKELVMHNPSSGEIWEIAREEGAHTFFEDGVEKVKAGITTFEEVMRVAPIEEYHSSSKKKK